ncbi:sigma-54-dependent transcriptional regulator [Kineobactrum salinum]|uniref:Sigma-54-dependent Fis family transcriptional regulator n=1 Tax=Kineobactrum salinum TaxID=2708301 RepID=A0A6C0U0P6_9GAMM|nr:sigma-54 dependent transcriptional regulator [Kineobactrum salinum]QIB65680.1 sigma-54-dependent Fis family transcriptional regulator [Kineobactrum salinum]
MSEDRILLVEDDFSLRELLREELEAEGYPVTAVESAEAAVSQLQQQAPALVLSDLRLPGADGLSLLQHLQPLTPRPALLIITAFGTVRQAVAALQAGADDFITKPLDVDHLLLTVQRLLENRRLYQEVNVYRSLLAEQTFHGMVASSPPMANLFDQVRRVALAEGPVLILGESGTGKELVARAIHEESSRSAGSFLAVNCGGIPGELMESEFFGHVSGAFTGARSRRAGLFQQANGGTLLLDELGEMPGALQAKLLRVLQDGQIRAVGSDQETHVDVRILAATNRDLQAAVEQGEFREDLYFRLETFSLRVPALRERGEDLLQLASFFLARFGARRSHRIRGFSDEALRCLQSYNFPGNVRELENAIERAVTFCDGPLIEPQHLPRRIIEFKAATVPGEADSAQLAAGEFTAWPEDPAALPSIDELQKHYVDHVLTITGGNKRQAAQILGITRRTLYRWLES